MAPASVARALAGSRGQPCHASAAKAPAKSLANSAAGAMDPVTSNRRYRMRAASATGPAGTRIAVSKASRQVSLSFVGRNEGMQMGGKSSRRPEPAPRGNDCRYTVNSSGKRDGRLRFLVVFALPGLMFIPRVFRMSLADV